MPQLSLRHDEHISQAGFRDMSATEDGQAQVEKPVPFPEVADDHDDTANSGRAEGRNRGKTDGAVSGHKRGLSGTILSKISFSRRSSGSDKAALNGASEGEDAKIGTGNAMAQAQQAVKQRTRKGSLRKAALLGKGRDRKGSDTKQKSPLRRPQLSPENERPSIAQLQVDDSDMTPRPSSDLSTPVSSPVSPPRWPLFSASRLSLASIRSSVPSVDPASSAASVTSPTLPTDASTTDDDEQLAFPRIPKFIARKPPSSSGDSYFPPQKIIKHWSSASRTKSPLATQPQSLTNSPVTTPEEWDYSETAFWGYVILIVTWLVFVVGIGSCFDVWSWAWDVGETPKAPPELEDDPTLPIVGYYPALLVLTCIMAWVWVVVAWVGMKYFRHADLRGDDA